MKCKKKVLHSDLENVTWLNLSQILSLENHKLECILLIMMEQMQKVHDKYEMERKGYMTFKKLIQTK